MNPNQETPDADDKLQNVYNPLKVVQPGERVICEIRRHPVGLMGIYFSVGLIIIVSLTAAIAAPQFLPSMTAQAKMGLIAGALILAAISLLYAYIAASIYKANRWIVSTDSITQISQVGLFRKQTSQLSLANLEDVTVDQDGILQSMFGFGTLHAESAGERSKFAFTFCPKPSEYAKQVIGAHEAYIANKPEETRVGNYGLTNSQNFNEIPQQPYQQPAQPVAPQPYPPVEPQQPSPNEQQYPPSQNGPIQ